MRFISIRLCGMTALSQSYVVSTTIADFSGHDLDPSQSQLKCSSIS